MIFENAWRSTWRRKGYSILLVIVFTIITAAVVVSLAIMQAAQTAKTSGLANQMVTATISMNRSQVIKDAAGGSTDGSSAASTDDASAREAARTAMDDMKLTLSDRARQAPARRQPRRVPVPPPRIQRNPANPATARCRAATGEVTWAAAWAAR
ncbi:MAG: hypothetical protein PUF51_05330 [Bifidobacteriaceae bacterium]|nr:hypothetical protein [Bifidobacteriaceae bacterium]